MPVVVLLQIARRRIVRQANDVPLGAITVVVNAQRNAATPLPIEHHKRRLLFVHDVGQQPLVRVCSQHRFDVAVECGAADDLLWHERVTPVRTDGDDPRPVFPIVVMLAQDVEIEPEHVRISLEIPPARHRRPSLVATDERDGDYHRHQQASENRAAATGGDDQRSSHREQDADAVRRFRTCGRGAPATVFVVAAVFARGVAVAIAVVRRLLATGHETGHHTQDTEKITLH